MTLFVDASDSPHVKAHATGRWAEILFRALSTRVASRWQFISFRGTRNGESRGVVDLLAIRKDTSDPAQRSLKRGDLFEVILVQVKGGLAPPPTKEDCLRLKAVAKHHRAMAIVLFEWQKGKRCRFSKLGPRLQWVPTTASELFA